MPPSIRPPTRASSSLISLLVGPTLRTTTSSQGTCRLLSGRHNVVVSQTPPPNPGPTVAGSGIDYNLPPLSSSQQHSQHHQQENQHSIPPPPPQGFLPRLLHFLRTHPLTLSFSRLLSHLDNLLGSPSTRLLSHPFRVLFSTLKLLAFTHLFLEHVLSMAPASGPSMLPTFEVVGEWLVVSRFHKYGNSVKVGDLVVYQIPISTSGELGVKRIMGMPGDYVLVDTPVPGGGTVEGEVLGERPGGDGDDIMIQVPEGHCWVVGDNLTASRDSRTFGPVPLALIRGKVFAKIQSNWLPKLIRNPLERVELEDVMA
ncbi:mitochondrial inner membrane protease [Copromyces sp. CBS 386.78]|nr:mitochondrial inner membrane protease [Copromyces sp. CBS 386.78]